MGALSVFDTRTYEEKLTFKKDNSVQVSRFAPRIDIEEVFISPNLKFILVVKRSELRLYKQANGQLLVKLPYDQKWNKIATVTMSDRFIVYRTNDDTKTLHKYHIEDYGN